MLASLSSKKPSPEQYPDWLRVNHRIDLRVAQNRYENQTTFMKSQFEGSSFWLGLADEIPNYEAEYRRDSGYDLLLGGFPALHVKPWTSFLEKTYRINVLNNRVDWPNPPGGDSWCLPDRLDCGITDVLRTCFTVKYLDGVEFIAEKIREQGSSAGVTCNIDRVARDEGYYAFHILVPYRFRLNDIDWLTHEVATSVELQITTQLQDAIRNMLHKYYESRRLEAPREQQLWKWDYRTVEFGTNYLGHILHYIEAMIVDLRDKQRSETDGSRSGPVA